MENISVPGVINITTEEREECKSIVLTLINLISSNN